MHTKNLPKLMILAACLALAACAETQTVTTPDDSGLAGELVDANGVAAPKWVTNPAKYKGDGGKVICGEGSTGSTRNMNMAQSAAAGRGRTSLARTLETKVSAMLKDYQSTTTGGEAFGKAANDEQHIEDVSKQLTQATLSGTETHETWISKKGTLHSLVCLDVEKFKGVVSGLKQLNEQVRAAVVQRADRAFEELDAATNQ
jgi:hypothetical protein